MFDISFPIAFTSGIISFFAPCVVALLPAYIGYITGVSLQDLQTYGFEKFKTRLLISSIFYILGFSLIFVVLGTAAAGIGQILRMYDSVIRIVGGALMFILGLNIAGLLPIGFLSKERKVTLPTWVNNLGYARASLLGVVFATAWTPCVGAILGSILSLAAVSQTAAFGALLLFIYSLGISIPFITVALTIAHAPKYIPFIAQKIGPISSISGIILAILGILLITNTYRFLNAWLFQLAFALGYQIK